MENIYGQTENKMNSIVDLPDGYASNAGNTLYSWLGSLWRGLHKGDGMIRGLQAARGIRLAQLYLNILEAASLKDRINAPVFHRELWHPIVLRISDRDKAQENMLKIGMDGVIGPQPEGSVYGEGAVFSMGRMADFENFVTYPVDACIAGGAVSIVDNIIKPTISMENGDDKDFVIRNGSIIFHRSNDPLRDGTPFDKYDIEGFVEIDGVKVPDQEVVLWASDVLIDKHYISEHMSYALGADSPSSAEVKRILNAAWSSVTSGLTPELIRTLMATMLNVPVIQNDTETVIDIEPEHDNDGERLSTIVHTDKGTYRVSPKATIRPQIHPGSVMRRGDLLDESLRVYPFLNGHTDENGMFSIPIEEDIPSITLPKDILRARTEYGVYAMWGNTKVKRDGSRLYFDVGGTDDDVRALWEDIWNSADSRGIEMESIIGEEGDEISPARFVLDNLVGANTLFVIVDRSQIDDTSMMHDPMFFDMLNSVVPSAVRLFLVEHWPVGEDDRMSMASSRESDIISAELPLIVECVHGSALPGMSGRGSSYGEHVSMRFIRPSQRNVRGSKEEER